MFAVIKMFIAISVISFASWLSGRKPELAGFITALPLVSILAITFSYMQYQDSDIANQYAKSIFFAIPISWSFFIPFLLSEKITLDFWVAYTIGIVFLIIGYFLHSFIINFFN